MVALLMIEVVFVLVGYWLVGWCHGTLLFVVDCRLFSEFK